MVSQKLNYKCRICEAKGRVLAVLEGFLTGNICSILRNDVLGDLTGIGY